MQQQHAAVVSAGAFVAPRGACAAQNLPILSTRCPSPLRRVEVLLMSQEPEALDRPRSVFSPQSPAEHPAAGSEPVLLLDVAEQDWLLLQSKEKISLPLPCPAGARDSCATAEEREVPIEKFPQNGLC